VDAARGGVDDGTLIHSNMHCVFLILCVIVKDHVPADVWNQYNHEEEISKLKVLISLVLFRIEQNDG
jgi:hypothetical protein